MKKKYVLGSVIVALLMLVSTQIVFLDIARSSDPTAHEGDADVGDLWISELDVSSELQIVDNIGISHAEAEDDWVIWDDGSGNINASWSLDIERNHPEYYVLFCFAIYNADDECKEIGNISRSKTYNANMDYDESGTLSVAISFTQQQQSMGSQTLVCWLGAFVRINGTTEAKNFSCIAQERCVVAVDFETPDGQPNFVTYRDEANREFPHHWAWRDGWSESSRFADEDDMLNTQTGFSVGNQNIQQQQYNHTWFMGNVSVRIPSIRWHYIIFKDFEIDQLIRDWSIGENEYIDGYVNFNYTIVNNRSIPVPIWFTIKVVATEPIIDEVIGRLNHLWFYENIPSGLGHILGYVTAYNDTRGSDDYINVNGRVWAGTILPITFKLSKYGSYQIHINNSVNQDIPSSSSNIYWESSVVYSNLTSTSISVDSTTQAGVTTVDVDISDILSSDDECIYSYSADRGDMRVEFTC